MSNAHVDELVALIRSIEADAYERGKADAKREIMTYLTTNAALESGTSGPGEKQPRRRRQGIIERATSDRVRAPKGTTAALINRALWPHGGLTPAEILTYAETEYEKMISGASLRNQLRRGREEGRYRRTDDGRWYMVDTGKDEAEGQPGKAQPSASNRSQGESHAPAIAE